MTTVAMRVGEILVDPDTSAPIVVLHGVEDDNLYLPISIGGMEATAIAIAMADVESPRPLTHDLLVSVLNEVGTYVRTVTITDLIHGTFYAEITLVDDQGNKVEVDSRPSDGIALVLRTGASLHVAEAVLVEAGRMLDEDEPGSSHQPPDPPRAKRVQPVDHTDVRLEDLDPDTFGKYKM
jgi:bifunctional DNase/RNase